MSGTVLGCPQSYTCLISYRGGRPWVGRLENITSVQWDRKLNALGEAVVTMGADSVSAQCCALMSTLADDRSMRAYELHVFRDREKVWCGPIMTVTETRGPTNSAFTITARDVLEYLDTYGHWLQAGYNITDDVVNIATAVLGADLATDDPGIGRELTATLSGIVATRSAARASASIVAELTALTALGLRFTTAVRQVLLGGLTGTPFGAPIRLTVDDLAGDVSLAHDGSVYCNTVYGSSGNAASQVPANQIPPDDPLMVTLGAPEPGWRGRVETGVSSSSGSVGQSSVLAAAQAAYFGARRPRVLRVADNSVISENATVTVGQLVCGSVVKLAGNGRFCTWVDQDLQLVRVSGTYGNDGEKIGISLGPVG